MASEAIDVVATLYPKADKIEELAAGIADLTKKVHDNEPGTLIYYPIRIAEKNEIVVVERYKDMAAHKAHVGSAYFKEFGLKAREWMEKPLEVKMGSQVAGSVRVSRI